MKCGDIMSKNMNDLTELRETHLITVENEIEAAHVESILDAHEILYLKKHEDAGEYLELFMGKSNFGIEYYVPLRQYEKAKTIVSDEYGVDLHEERELSEEEVAFLKRRQLKAFLSLILLIPGVIILALFAAVWFKGIYL